MYLDETYTFKTRRKDTMLIISLLFLSALYPALAEPIRSCPEKCKCFIDSEYAPYSFNTAECDSLLWKKVYYPNILQLKLRPASPTEQCHLANFTAKLFPKLQKLNLSNCSLTSIPPSGTNNFDSLYWIDVSNNHIRSMPSNALDTYLHISQIILSNNPLNPHSPPALNSSTMNQMVMDSCGIQTLPPHTFAGMPKLKYLSLANNSLRFLQEKTFPPHLVDLDLSKNRIVNVPMNELLRLHNLSELNLSANPVNCTCELVRFQDYLSRRVIFVDGMTCAYPHKYVGLGASRIRENDLCDAAQNVDSSSSEEKCVPTTNTICNNGAGVNEDYVNDQSVDENERALQQDQLIEYQGDEAAKDADVLVEGSGDGIVGTDKPASDTEEKQTSTPATNNEAGSSSENPPTPKNDVIKMVDELGNSTDSSVVTETTAAASSSETPSTESTSASSSVAPETTSVEPSSTSSESPSSESSSAAESTSGEPSNATPESASTESSSTSTAAPSESSSTSESASTESSSISSAAPSANAASESSSSVIPETVTTSTLAPVGDALGSGNRNESSSESKTLYGYLIPGLALLLIGLVCLAVYCSQCASKVATYKPETNVDGSELQEVSLLPDSNHPTIVKHTSKYPGEKENGQTERLMSEHEQTNGRSAVIAEVNGNGSQHSDETIECCKLANGQSAAANQNDQGNVECTVVKVTTLPDSVPKTAVIRDL